MLKGGVSYNGGAGSGGIAGATPWGMIAQQINKEKDNLRETFNNAAGHAANNALAASNFRVNFNPIQGQFIAPQNMQTQQNTGMANLYNYLVR
jgi:hypothetical protein